MIYDCLENADRYSALHPGFAAAFEFLRKTDFTKLPTGKNEIDGERMFVMVGRDAGQGREKRKLEFHRQYIDIQCVMDGIDEIGWRSTVRCQHLDEEYDPKREVGFYRDLPESYVNVGVRQFVIFFPTDAHAPLSGKGEMLKPVVKVAVDWK